jgi:type I restriction-modification system DNA methylase subunit
MANPLTTSRNKYYENEKNSSIYTPPGVCQFLFDLIDPWFEHNPINKTILDPAVGSGNLLRPFAANGYNCIGYDINDDKERIKEVKFIKKNFLEENTRYPDVSLVICNPPFNTDQRNKDYLKENNLGKALLPELFAEQIFDLYGSDIPLMLFSPMGILFNQRTFSKRWKKMRDIWPEITTIITLPLNIFPNVEFHNLILIFNYPQLLGHYFLPEEYL